MARLKFVLKATRVAGGQLAADETFVAYSDAAGTALADISLSSGGSAIAGSTFELDSLGGATIWGPTDNTSNLWVRSLVEPGLPVQAITADPDARLDTLEAGGSGIAATIFDAKGDLIAATAADTASRLAVGANDTVLTADSAMGTGLKWAAAAGAHPNLATHDALGLATDAELTTHAGAADPHAGYVLESAHTLAGHDPLSRGSFPATFDGKVVPAANTGSVGVSNRGWYMLGTEGAAQNINTLILHVVVASGAYSLAVYSSTGTGRARAPATRLATSGAITTASTGEVAFTLGSTVAYVPFETWFFLSADNTTATFARVSGLTAPMAGLSYLQASAHPAPDPAASLTAGSVAYWIAGSLV